MDFSYCLISTPALTVHYDAMHQCLFNEWRGPHTEASVRRYGAEILSCLYAHPSTRILSDHRQLQGAWAGAAPWVGGHLLARFAALGVGHLAWVVAPDNQLSMEALVRARQHATAPVVALFEDVTSAKDWLCQQAPEHPARPFLS